jgi:UDP-N-acetylmuramate dehydrogenase
VNGGRAAIERAARLLGPRAARDVPLAPLTTYRVGGPAALFVRAERVEDLTAVAAAHRATGLPVLVVGRGSNLLIADEGFAGIAVSVTDLAATIDVGPAGREGRRGEAVEVAAGGGVALPVLARRTAAAGLTGFEWAVGVPGSVGGAVKMNAGGHGSDMAACVTTVDLVDLTGPADAPVTVAAGSLGLRFRGSDVTDEQVVLTVRLGLARGDREAAEREIAEIVRWRRQNQPGGQNAGSVFVNPVPGEVSAGSLVDALGLRGFRVGTAWVSEKHANFIQAAEGGRSADVRAVMEEVRRRVADATGYVLRSEVRLVGFELDDRPALGRAGVHP